MTWRKPKVVEHRPDAASSIGASQLDDRHMTVVTGLDTLESGPDAVDEGVSSRADRLPRALHHEVLREELAPRIPLLGVDIQEVPRLELLDRLEVEQSFE